MGQIEISASWYDVMKMTYHFHDIPAKNAQPVSNQEKTSDVSKLRDSLPNSWPAHFKNVKVMKDKD